MKRLIFILIFGILINELSYSQCLTPTYTFKSGNGIDGFKDFVTIDENGIAGGTISHDQTGVNFLPSTNGTGVVAGTDVRIYKQLGRTLNDSTWKVECKFNFIKGRSPGHVLMALSEGTSEVFAPVAQQSIYIVIHRADLNNFPASGTYVTGEYDISDQGTAIVVYYKNASGTQYIGSTPINIEPNEVGKVLDARLERLGSYQYRLTKLNTDGSELSSSAFNTNDKLTGLNTIQIAGNSAGWSKRTLTANFNDYVIFEPNCVGISSLSISGIVHQGNNYLVNGKVLAINTSTNQTFTTFTNSFGVFKFESITEGNYILKSLAFDGESYFSTYYPNTIDSSKAEVVTLGGSIEDLDIQMESKANITQINVLDMVKIAPNPFGDELNLKLLLNKFKNAEISLLNSFGQTVIKYNTKNIDNSTIDTSMLKLGLYFLKLNIDGEVKIISVLKK